MINIVKWQSYQSESIDLINHYQKFQNKSLYKLKIIILALYENTHTHTKTKTRKLK